MIQIRIHGRSGQSVVAAAELLSAPAFSEGKLAVPSQPKCSAAVSLSCRDSRSFVTRMSRCLIRSARWTSFGPRCLIRSARRGPDWDVHPRQHGVAR
jgi:hypothetical protein